MLRRPVSAATSLRLLWACSKLGGDLGDLEDLTAICSAATALFEISQSPSGDLADFADRSEVAVLCDWGISNEQDEVAKVLPELLRDAKVPKLFWVDNPGRESQCFQDKRVRAKLHFAFHNRGIFLPLKSHWILTTTPFSSTSDMVAEAVFYSMAFAKLAVPEIARTVTIVKFMICSVWTRLYVPWWRH